jgi:transcriptional regulator with XRE-family HTH domain
MRLIQERRERLGVSQRAAAALAGMSASRYRQLENGGREIRGTWIPEDAPDKTLAHMALAVRLVPGDIEPFSPMAGLMLADLMAEHDASSQQDASDAARMVGALPDNGSLSARQRAILESEVAESLRRVRRE